jgi:sulfonate dioxygenase
VAGTTFLIALDVPPSGGGDTVFASSVVAYDRLSPEFRKRLHGIKVYHDGLRLENPAREAGSVVRYKSGSSIHSLIRTHPVSSLTLFIVVSNIQATGKKSLFVSPNFATHIIDFKKEESENLSTFLFPSESIFKPV